MEMRHTWDKGSSPATASRRSALLHQHCVGPGSRVHHADSPVVQRVLEQQLVDLPVVRPSSLCSVDEGDAVRVNVLNEAILGGPRSSIGYISFGQLEHETLKLADAVLAGHEIQEAVGELRRDVHPGEAKAADYALVVANGISVLHDLCACVFVCMSVSRGQCQAVSAEHQPGQCVTTRVAAGEREKALTFSSSRSIACRRAQYRASAVRLLLPRFLFTAPAPGSGLGGGG